MLLKGAVSTGNSEKWKVIQTDTVEKSVVTRLGKKKQAVQDARRKIQISSKKESNLGRGSSLLTPNRYHLILTAKNTGVKAYDWENLNTRSLIFISISLDLQSRPKVVGTLELPFLVICQCTKIYPTALMCWSPLSYLDEAWSHAGSVVLMRQLHSLYRAGTERWEFKREWPRSWLFLAVSAVVAILILLNKDRSY